MRRCCEPPKKGSLCHRYPAHRLRSLRQAPRSWAHASPARAPGSGSPVPAFKPGNFKRALLRTIKNPPELLAREGPLCGLSISLTQDRSHEPGVRHRSANSLSIVRRAFCIRGSSQGSCWFANPMSARAREIRQRLAIVKRQVEQCCNGRRDHPTHVTYITSIAIS